MIPEHIHREGWSAAAAFGCTADGCGTQDTTQLCGCHGRRCPDHTAHEED